MPNDSAYEGSTGKRWIRVGGGRSAAAGYAAALIPAILGGVGLLLRSTVQELASRARIERPGEY
jgi:hypothetical protein